MQSRRVGVLGRPRERQVQGPVRAADQEVAVEVQRLRQRRVQDVAQHAPVQVVAVGQPHVVQAPQQVPGLVGLGRRPGNAHRARAAGAQPPVTGVRERVRVTVAVRGRDGHLEVRVVAPEGLGDGVEFGVVAAVDDRVGDLDVEVPPDRGPAVADLGEPRAPFGHDGPVRAGGGRDLVQLDPVEPLHLLVGHRDEAAVVVVVPPAAVAGEQRVRVRGKRFPHGRAGVRGVRGAREAVGDGGGEQPSRADRAFLPGRGVPAPGEHRLRAVPGPDLGRRVGDVLGRLADGPGRRRLQRLERPGGPGFPGARRQRNEQHTEVVVHDGGEGDRPPRRGDGAAEFGVVEVERPVDAGDRAGQGQREEADRQPGQPDAGFPLDPLVLDLGVAQHHLEHLRRRPGVDLGAEVAVGQERTFLPALREPLPDHPGVRGYVPVRIRRVRRVAGAERGRGCAAPEAAERGGPRDDRSRAEHRPPGHCVHEAPPDSYYVSTRSTVGARDVSRHRAEIPELLSRKP